ncbi:methionyl-tRNA formyltransferase [Oceanobacillus limi]|uniref:Methionyl-tRNA formyltransferase n=1 Tax=Oceanobacillus limi TaxID=930131 RepID=A0A1I0BKQ3_9BACI|nr:formyltransferase family protein [Oceanobacillus limi]SET07587.1 methionyl-tRNA formyltransferase [Oceanobacillus limi]
MNILILGPKSERLSYFFTKNRDNVIYYEEKLYLSSKVLKNIDFIISYRYRYIIQEEIIKKFHKKIINLHISYLPWNKGADPNLWSFLEDTPKGVTIHYMDNGIDTGDILVQETITVFADDTLKTTYDRLTKTIELLLIKHWNNIKKAEYSAVKQLHPNGSYHKSKDKQPYLYLLTKGWETPIKNLIGRANK